MDALYTRILVPLDGSELAKQVLPYVRVIGKGLKARVELLRVFDPVSPSLADPIHGRYLDQIVTSFRNQTQDYLEGVASSLRKDGLKVSSTVHEGDAASYIVSEAEKEASTLVAMSTHGRSGVQRWLLGSVADKVLHATTNPLLLVRATAASKTSNESTLRTILVPLDGSPLAELVLPHVVTVAKQMKLEVVLLRAYSPPPQAYMVEGYAPDFDQLTVTMRDEAKRYLEEKKSQLQGDGLDKVSYMLLEGDAPGQIIDLARETPDNLVAMCTHGRSGIGRWVLGSVTDRVVRHCGDPVLVIRPRQM